MDERDRRPGDPPTGTASESLNSPPIISQDQKGSSLASDGKVIVEMTPEEVDEYFRGLILLITHRGVEH